MLVDIKENQILKEDSYNRLFLSATLKDLNLKCKIYKNNFYLDSFNYFPITQNFETFYNLFKRHDLNSLDHFYTKEFFKSFIDKKNNFKNIKNSFVLGTSPADNYFTNIIYFFPRIFFINENKINLIIHRNLSNKFRNLIKTICSIRGVDITFNYIDDGFYKFNNCSIPQFFNNTISINILKFFLNKIIKNVESPDLKSKIYVRRDDASYRKIINEADLIEKLRNNGFEIINPQHFEILTQMKIFSNAKLIISPHGSNLSNIIFCKPGTKIVEISPQFNNKYDKYLSGRYKDISDKIGLSFSQVKADSVDVNKHSVIAKKYIHSEILKNSNYYKNLIIKISEIDKLISNL